MATATRPDPAAQVKRLRRSLERSSAKSAALRKSLAAALEREEASAGILRIISGFPADVQPVFEAIAHSAATLFRSAFANVFRYDGKLMHYAASHLVSPEQIELVKHGFPAPPTRGRVAGRAILARAVVCIEDALADREYDHEVAAGAGWRRMFAVPMLREGVPIGAIAVGWDEPGPIAEELINLLRTFAEQAVIAIENVRLFNETKEALERQTATAEILTVISSSPTDVQPVFDAIVRSSMALIGGYSAVVTRLVDDTLHLAALTTTSASGDSALRNWFPMAGARERGLFGVVIRTAAPICCGDTETDPIAESTGLRDLARARGFRGVATVPLIHEGAVIGTLSVTRREPGAFSEHQVNLLKTFADQAVIAVENVRLFNELKARTEALGRSVRQLTALGEVGQAISSTLDLETVLQAIVQRAVQLTGLDACEIFEYDEQAEQFHLKAAENLDQRIVEALRRAPLRRGEGAVGKAGQTGEPAEIVDILDGTYRSTLRELLVESGMRALLAVPLLRDNHLLGGLVINRKSPGSFAPDVVALLKTFATQSAVAIQNARLFREIAEKGRQLEEASRHKSRFLASMSHELRTPLNAILGFNEMLLDGLYGDVPEGMQEPLADIQSSGKHLLRLINNVLDLAKIEAGRMELALADYSVQDLVEGVRSTLRPLAVEKGLELVVAVPDDVPLAYGDPGRLTQCLVNLAGNSLKFTKQGRVEIAVAHRDGILAFRVVDSGIGIPPEKIGSLFTEFKQTDAAIASEYGGSGLGLSITKKFVEMHGGRIRVESEPGHGSTFSFEIPLRAQERIAA